MNRKIKFTLIFKQKLIIDNEIFLFIIKKYVSCVDIIFPRLRDGTNAAPGQSWSDNTTDDR